MAEPHEEAGTAHVTVNSTEAKLARGELPNSTTSRGSAAATRALASCDTASLAPGCPLVLSRWALTRSVTPRSIWESPAVSSRAQGLARAGTCQQTKPRCGSSGETAAVVDQSPTDPSVDLVVEDAVLLAPTPVPAGSVAVISDNRSDLFMDSLSFGFLPLSPIKGAVVASRPDDAGLRPEDCLPPADWRR